MVTTAIRITKISENLSVNLNLLNKNAYNLNSIKENFDIVWHAGFLEHFSKEEQYKLLKNWSKLNCKKHICM